MEKQILMERVWDRAYISNLPDSAFALIQSGGEKDETGRIVPRSLRRLPHHGADGSIDLPHLRNALARASQMKDVSEEERNGAIAHLQRHAKAAGIDESAEAQREPLKHAWKEQEAPVEFQIAPEPTMDELIVSIEDLVEQINLRLDILEAKDKKPEGEPLGEAKKQIEVVRNQLGMVTEQKKTLEGALKDSEAKIRTLEERLSKPLGEAVIEPNAAQPSVPEGCLRKDDIRALLPERVPTYWGYGPYELVRRLKHVLGE